MGGDVSMGRIIYQVAIPPISLPQQQLTIAGALPAANPLHQSLE